MPIEDIPDPPQHPRHDSVPRGVYFSGRDQNIQNIQNIFNVTGSSPFDFLLPSLVPPLGIRATRLLRGRDDLVAELSANTAGGMVHVLHGLGGVGKTQVALEVAATLADRGHKIWWVSVVDGTSTRAGLRAVGYAAGASPADFEMANAADVLWRYLHQFQEPWLLVLDNVYEPQHLFGADSSDLLDGRGWVRPAPAGGRILITTRDGSETTWASWTRRHRITPLSVTEGAHVLVDLAGGKTSDALPLAERLAGLPLALRLAGQAISKARMVPDHWEPELPRSFESYRAALAEHFGEVFQVAAGPMSTLEAHGLVGQTWELSLMVLDGRSFHEARRVLRLLACFADAPIPCGLLLDPDLLRGSQLLPGITGQRLSDVLSALESQSLITVSNKSSEGRIGPVAVIHPLVRDVNLSHPDVSSDSSPWPPLALQLVTTHADSSVIGAPEDPEAWPRWQMLAPHCLYFLRSIAQRQYGVNDEIASSICIAANLSALYLFACGQYRQAENELRQIISFGRGTVGDQDDRVLESRHILARVLTARDRTDEAEAEYRSIIEMQTNRYGAEDLKTLTIRFDFISVLDIQGRKQLAKSEAEAILRARRRILGDDDPATLASRQYLAIILGRLGDPQAAAVELRKVLEVQKRILGDENAETFITRHNLAWALLDRHRFSDAEAELTELLRMEQQQLGEDHPQTLATRHNRVSVLVQLDRIEEAEAELRAVLLLTRAQLGDEHHHTRIARQSLANLLYISGRIDEARLIDEDYVNSFWVDDMWRRDMWTMYGI